MNNLTDKLIREAVESIDFIARAYNKDGKSIVYEKLGENEGLNVDLVKAVMEEKIRQAVEETTKMIIDEEYIDGKEEKVKYYLNKVA